MTVRESDEYWGTIIATMHLPRRDVALMVGKTVSQIRWARRTVTEGRVPTGVGGWRDDELDIIREGAHLSAKQLADRLPGRGWQAIKKKRTQIGALEGKARDASRLNPASVGRRPLIAKTCRKCGLLLAGPWYAWRSGSRTWASECKGCQAQRGRVAYAAGKKPTSTSGNLKRQAISRSDVSRGGLFYTQEDFAVLAEAGLTILQKSLLLRRSYYATAHAVWRFGFASAPNVLGDPERDAWVISNPNAGRVADIAATLVASNAERAFRPEPQW